MFFHVKCKVKVFFVRARARGGHHAFRYKSALRLRSFRFNRSREQQIKENIYTLLFCWQTQ